MSSFGLIEKYRAVSYAVTTASVLYLILYIQLQQILMLSAILLSDTGT
jgi:hypothetical protein